MANILYDSANTTVTLNGRVFVDLANGDAVKIAFPNEVSSKTMGINKSSVIKQRMDKDSADVTIRVLKASTDDVFLNNALNQPSPTIFGGSIKTNFSRDGVDGVDSYALENGTIMKRPEDTRNNVDGEEIMEYSIAFVSAVRMI
jgi:hypothetical protein